MDIPYNTTFALTPITSQSLIYKNDCYPFLLEIAQRVGEVAIAALTPSLFDLVCKWNYSQKSSLLHTYSLKNDPALEWVSRGSIKQNYHYYLDQTAKIYKKYSSVSPHIRKIAENLCSWETAKGQIKVLTQEAKRMVSKDIFEHLVELCVNARTFFLEQKILYYPLEKCTFYLSGYLKK